MPDLSDWLEIVLPEDTINTIENPSFELTTAGWTPVGGTMARGVGGTVGAYGGTFVAIGAGATVTSNTGATATAGSTWTLSMWLTAFSPSVRLNIANTTTSTVAAYTAHSGNGTRERLTVTYTLPSGTAHLRAQIVDLRSSAWNAIAFDGAQLEAKAYATTYCDGTMDGCTWDGVTHASTSRRAATTRAGGRPMTLRQLGVDVTGMQGTGAPPIRHIAPGRGYGDGSEYQRAFVQPRVFTVTGIIPTTSYETLHATRATLLRAVMPDVLASGEALVLRYTGHGSGRVLQLRCRYEGGLDWDPPTVAAEKIALRFVSHEDPYWEAETERAQSLTAYGSQTVRANIVRQKSTGVWDIMGTVSGDSGGTNSILAFAVGLDGTVYAGGNFGVIGGVGAQYVARWTGAAWTNITAGGAANNLIRALAVGATGELYAGGDFTSIGGVACNRVAKYTPSTGAWSAMGTGLGGPVYSLLVSSDKAIRAAGTFTTNGTGTAANRVAYWTGATWSQVGASAMNNAVYALAEGTDGYIYAGGDFTTSDGVTTNRIARYTGTTWEAMGTGVDNTVRCLLSAPEGGVYVGGEFANASGGSASRIAHWTGSTWRPLGDGLTGTASAAGFVGVTSMALTKNGELVAVGAFASVGTSAGPWTSNGAGVWTGSTWRPIDAKLTYGTTFYLAAVAALPNGDIIYGGRDVSFLLSATPQAITGSARAYPRLHLTGPGNAVALGNATSEERVQLNQILAADEQMILDMRPGRTRLTSAWRGDIDHTLPAGSAVASFALYPGTNQVSAFADNASAFAVLTWRDRFWSLDSIPT